MKEHREATQRDNQDYIWRFAVQPEIDSPIDNNPMVEMVRSFLADLLHFGYLTRDGKRVDVDGFQFVNDSKTVYEIFPRIDSGKRTDRDN